MEITPRLKAFLDAEEIDEQHVLQIEPNGPIRHIITSSFKGWIACTNIEEQGEYVLVVGNWRTGEKKHFFSSPNKRKEKYNGIVKEQEERIEEERRKGEEKAREETQKILARCETFDTSHEYFVKKHLVAHEGARTRVNSFGKLDIVVPLKDFEGVIWGVQFIQDSGDKQFISGLRLKGSFFQFGKFTPQSEVVYLCEGWATGSSIRLATQEAVLCAMTAGNLKNVAEEFRKRFPTIPLIVCADKDANGVGETYAKQACAVGHATYILPKTSGTDFNDVHIESGIDEVTRQIRAYAPIEPSLIAASEYNGFHIQNKKGGLTPDVEGLYKYYKRKHPHFTHAESQVTYEWDGKKYIPTPNLMLENFAQRHFNPSVHSSAVSEFVKLVKRSSSTNNSDAQMSGVYNFQNGVLDNGELRPHSPKDYFLHVLPFDYIPDAVCPVFEKTLARVLNQDESLIRQFLEFMGYTLSGDTCWIHKALVLKGEGSNGKSTMIETMRYVIGAANCTSLTQSHLSIEHHLDCLNGKLANFADETPTKAGDTTTFKALISGDSVQARALYKPPYSLVSRAKFIFACNELPVTQDTTEGFFRRLSIIPFDVTFSPKDKDYDPFIVTKMKAEAPGIFNLCMKAYQQLKSRGRWVDGERTLSVLQEYKDEADVIRVWASEHITDTPDKFVPLSDAYDEFCIDAEKQGFRFIPTRPQFTKKLKLIYKNERRFSVVRVAGKSTRVLLDATLLE